MKKKFLILFLLISALMAVLFGVTDAAMRIQRVLHGVEKGVTLEGKDVGRWLEKEVKQYVEKKAVEIRQDPRNAFFDRNSGEIYPEVQGRIVNIKSTVAATMEAEANCSVSLNVVYIDPEITVEMLEKIQQEAGSFTTYIGGGGGGRVENIRIATKAIDYYLLAPGQVFSFNRTVGPTTAERGYKPAPVIVGGRIVQGFGGGICQVATTLYNAVDYAGLEVVERYPHSRPVGYVPRGRDATVSDHLDFKFRNSSPKYIVIRAWTDYRINITIMTH